jgi:thiamine-phosphate pyrophosphorylase
VFKPKSKRDHEPLVGVKGLLAAVKTAPLPVVAVGGIALDNIKQVVGTGVHAAATISCVAQAWQPKDAVRSLVRAFTVAPPGARVG